MKFESMKKTFATTSIALLATLLVSSCSTSIDIARRRHMGGFHVSIGGKGDSHKKTLSADMPARNHGDAEISISESNFIENCPEPVLLSSAEASAGITNPTPIYSAAFRPNEASREIRKAATNNAFQKTLSYGAKKNNPSYEITELKKRKMLGGKYGQALRSFGRVLTFLIYFGGMGTGVYLIISEQLGLGLAVMGLSILFLVICMILLGGSRASMNMFNENKNDGSDG